MKSIEKLDAVLFLLFEEFNRGQIKMSIRSMFFSLVSRDKKIDKDELRLITNNLSDKKYITVIIDSIGNVWDEVEYSITFDGKILCEQGGHVEQEKRAISEKNRNDTIATSVAAGTVALLVWQMIEFYLKNHDWIGCCHCAK
jgi:hypothetical protein